MEMFVAYAFHQKNGSKYIFLKEEEGQYEVISPEGKILSMKKEIFAPDVLETVCDLSSPFDKNFTRAQRELFYKKFYKESGLLSAA